MGFSALVLLGLLMHASASFGISTMRCGSNLVELGDHRNKVQELCGEPESIDIHYKIKGSTLHHPRRTLDIEEYEEVKVEEWIYYFGRKRIRQYLRFENGVLVEIQDIGRAW